MPDEDVPRLVSLVDEPTRSLALSSAEYRGGDFVLGRRIYEIFASHWPNAPEEEQLIAEPLNISRSTSSRRRRQSLSSVHLPVAVGEGRRSDPGA